MHQIQEKSIFSTDRFQVQARFLFLLAYLLLPFFQLTSIFLLLISTPFLVSRFPNQKQLFFLTILFCSLFAYIIIGSDEFRPKTKDLIPILSHFISAIVIIFSLFFTAFDISKAAIKQLSISVVAFVFFEGLFTLFYHPFIAAQRFMINPITDTQVHSTGQINTMALATGFLLLLSGRSFLGVLALFPFSIMAITYANRTGMLFAVTFIAIILFKFIKHTKLSFAIPLVGAASLSLIIICSMLPSTIIDLLNVGFVRLSTYGLETERTDLNARGLKEIISASHPFGGGQLEYWRDYPWYHNLFLDAYRVAGIPALFLFISLTIISLSATWKTKSGNLLFVWLISLSVMTTSVPIEGFFIEYTLVFSILSYALIRPTFLDDHS